MLEDQDARASRQNEPGVLVSPWIDLQPFERPTGAPTPARLFAEALARTMRPGEVHRFDRALQNIEGGAARFCASRINPTFPRSSRGLSAMDILAPGEALIVYADAAAKGGFGIITPSVDSLAVAVARARAVPNHLRRRMLVGHALAMLPAARKHDDVVERQVVAEELLSIVALILSEADLTALRRIDDGIPALAIAARTDCRGRPSVETMHVVTKFPGVWLGSSPATGRA